MELTDWQEDILAHQSPLTVVAAGRSVGKTTLALEWARRLAPAKVAYVMPYYANTAYVRPIAPSNVVLLASNDRHAALRSVDYVVLDETEWSTMPTYLERVLVVGTPYQRAAHWHYYLEANEAGAAWRIPGPARPDLNHLSWQARANLVGGWFVDADDDQAKLQRGEIVYNATAYQVWLPTRPRPEKAVPMATEQAALSAAYGLSKAWNLPLRPLPFGL